MLHKYRKTATIQAEQFDGSRRQLIEYAVIPDNDAYGMPIFFIKTLEGSMLLRKGDWIATGVDGEHWVIADDIFRKTYERCD